MATHDYVIANGTGSAVRADLNNALAAIVSNNSSSSEPSTKYAYQWWADTTTGQLKLRNAANNGWVTIFELDGTMLMEDGTVSAPGLAFASDLNTGFFSGGADKLNFATGGIERLEIGSSEVVFNDPSNDVDFRVESNGQTHMLFVDGGNDAVGIGTGSPSSYAAAARDLVIKNTTNAGITIRSGSSSDGSIYFNDTDDANQRGIIRFNHQTDALAFHTPAGEAMRIDSSGRLLVGTSSARTNYLNSTSYGPSLNIEGTSNSNRIISFIHNDSSGAPILVLGATGGSTAGSNTLIGTGAKCGHLSFEAADGSELVEAAKIECLIDGTPGANDMPGRLVFSTTADGASSPTERLRIDSSGDVAIGVSAATSRLTVEDSAATKANFTHSSSNKTSLYIESDDTSARIGSTYYGGGGSFKPLSFLTSGSERVRIDGSGNTWFNSSNFSTLYPGEGNTATGFFVESDGKATISRANTNPLTVNRNTSDGTLIDLRQAGSQEGTISVSGSTVSYNGAHLSRWSQLAAGAARTEILRGSVLSNLDEMCEWGEEDNEQLNRMQVSDVEGDKNVSGVFQGWDDDDDTYTNDFYCAMTGDFVIRIAQGTTVARGDLLMSAGDGTAKHQDDDIVRSKTIAKVTSTTVSETYADNSYCVPCVLMAC
jgi:hypothetical protein